MGRGGHVSISLGCLCVSLPVCLSRKMHLILSVSLSSCRRASIIQSCLAWSLSPPLCFCRPLASSLLFYSPPQHTRTLHLFVCCFSCRATLLVSPSTPLPRPDEAPVRLSPPPSQPATIPHDEHLHTPTATHRSSASRYSCRDFLHMLDIDLRPSAGSPRPLNLIPSTKPHCCVGVGARECKRVWPSRLCECVKMCLCITRRRRATFEGLAWVQWAQEKFTVYCSKAK